VDDIETGEWFDPSVLQRLLPTTIAVTVGEGEHKIQNVQIGGSEHATLKLHSPAGL
jgi:hypothetical protein